MEHSVVFTVGKDLSHLAVALNALEDCAVSVSHLESRQPASGGEGLEYLLQFSSSHSLDHVVTRLEKAVEAVSVISHSSSEALENIPWFPRTIADVGRCCTALYKYGADLTPDHPGYGDAHYQERRHEIATIAKNYRHGKPIPKMTYTSKEVETWGEVFRSQVELYPTHACKEYNQHFPSLFSQCGYREDSIPQLEDVSAYLKAKTGWQLWPVIGWISARDFLNSLAFRVFPTTQYIRHHSKPYYTPEPDICHELMGHAPLFCDPAFAEFSQEIGLASLGISDEWIEKLATLYWFTVEFGLVNEGGSPRAYGAGLLSGNEELQYCLTAAPERRELNIEQTLVTQYPQTGLQPLYFVANSMEAMRDDMRVFAQSIPRPFSVSYKLLTQSVETHMYKQ